ncbi:MAG TPA: type II secretion system protein [bacterium]|nr:type II secretion system protein [bacterium]
MQTRGREGGFSLIEMLIVVGILGVLASILIPNFVRSRAASQLAVAQLDLRNIGAALDLYFNENQLYPSATDWKTTLESGGYIRAVPVSPIDRAPYGYQTNAARDNYVLWDGPNKYSQAGVAGYIIYTPAGGNQLGVSSIPTP